MTHAPTLDLCANFRQQAQNKRTFFLLLAVGHRFDALQSLAFVLIELIFHLRLEKSEKITIKYRKLVHFDYEIPYIIFRCFSVHEISLKNSKIHHLRCVLDVQRASGGVMRRLTIRWSYLS